MQLSSKTNSMTMTIGQVNMAISQFEFSKTYGQYMETIDDAVYHLTTDLEKFWYEVAELPKLCEFVQKSRTDSM